MWWAWPVEHRFQTTRLRIPALKGPAARLALEYGSDKLAGIYRSVCGVHSNVVAAPDPRFEVGQNQGPATMATPNVQVLRATSCYDFLVKCI